MANRVLLVEDDAAIATVVRSALESEGYEVTHADSIVARDACLAKTTFAAMLTDVMLGDGDGIDALQRVAGKMPVIVLSAQNTLDTAVRATQAGAFEYFPKPFDLEELLHAVRQAVGRQAARGARKRERPDGGEESLPLVGRSQAMQSVYRMITRVLRNDLTVLVLGESGTGKELVAEAIHQLGSRKTGPFIAVNAAAIPGDLIESELFGHERGAFTGAISQAIGKFEQANGGTLFLDEIGDMPIEAQTRLLRALQSGRIRRVGGRQEIATDVRIIAATNRDLAPMIASGTFREDLFYRLNVVPITLPPLRDRRKDIAPLAAHFLQLAAQEGLPHRRLSDAATAQLAALPWPGNVRELRNAVFRLAVMSRDDIIDDVAVDTILDTPALVGVDKNSAMGAAFSSWIAEARPAPGTVYRAYLDAAERPLIEWALNQTDGNQLRAAALLGINRNTLHKKLRDLEISPR